MLLVSRIGSFSGGTLLWFLRDTPLPCLWGPLTSSFFGVTAALCPFIDSGKPPGPCGLLSTGFHCCARGGPCWAEPEIAPYMCSGCGPCLVFGKDSHIFAPTNLGGASRSQCNYYFLWLVHQHPASLLLVL